MRTGNSLLILAGSAGLALAASGIVHSPTTGVTSTPATDSSQFGQMELPFHPVFAQGTTPRQMEEAYRKLLEQYGVGLEHMIGGAGLELEPVTRWPGAIGTPVNLTYSFPPDGTNTNGNGPNTIHATLNAQFGSPTVWEPLIAQALDEWGRVTGITYTLVSDDGASWPGSPGSLTRGDIRIVAGVIDGPGSVLAFNFFPNTGDMLLDSADNWAAGGNNSRFFRNVVTHENGHGIGLAHSCPVNQTKMMEPFINTSFDGIQLDDILAAQFLYGDPLEPNNTLGAASSLDAMGLASNTQLAINGLSLHNSTDGDIYSFQANAGSVLTQILAAPTGFTYLAGAQNPNGSCQPGAPFAALSQLDLILEVLNSTGAVLATANATGAGFSEELIGVALPFDGTYFLRVRANGNGSGTTPIQGYRLTATINLTALIGDVNGDGAINAADLATILVSWGPTGGGTSADINGDGVVDAADLAILLSNWTG